MLISHRGWFGERDPWQTEGGLVTDSRARRAADSVRHAGVDATHVAHSITKAFTLAHAANRPSALLLGRDLMWEEA